MSDLDDGSDTGVPTSGLDDGDSPISTFEVDGETVLYNADDADRWIQADNAVDLAEAV